MSHELFRYLIPGIFFYLPIYLAAALARVFKLDTEFNLLHGLVQKDVLTMISFLVLPTGWLVYHAWRTYWQLFKGGYEKREFLNRIRQAVRTYDQPDKARTVVDFLPILGKKFGMRWFSKSEFSIIFDPFKNILAVGFNSNASRKAREKGRRFFLHFVEAVSDLILFEDSSYDYARSISSARYGLWVSMFSLMAGSMASLGVVVYIYRQGSKPPSVSGWLSQTFIIVSESFVILVPATLVMLAFYRMKMARTEHEARVQLITQIHSGDRFIKESEIYSLIDPEVLARLQAVNKFYHSPSGGPKLAAFDMDGTLIRHDMGDAVLAMLIKKEEGPAGKHRLRIGFWKHYQNELAKSRPAGYEYAVTAMSTLSIQEVYQAARDVLEFPGPVIELSDGTRVPKPELVPRMQALVMWLHRHGFDVYLVTATNKWAAEVVAADWFGIAADHVFGVTTAVSEDRVTNTICRPAPIAEGKRHVWEGRFKDAPPLVGGGDSKGDYAMLELVEESGVVLWTGKPEERPNGSHVVQVDIRQLPHERVPTTVPAKAGS